MGSRLFIVAALLVFANSLLSACAQNPSEEGVDASAGRADEQGNTAQPSEEPTLVEDPTPIPEPTMTTAEGEASSQAIRDVVMGANPPKYQVLNDGTLIIEGDMLVRCADLLQFRRNYWEGQSPTPEARRQMRQAHKEHIAVCTRAGFPPDKTQQSP